MSTEAQSTIASRFFQLNKLILGKSNSTIPDKYLVHRDGLLDVLFALYEECNVEHLRKDKHIGAFVNRFKSVVNELKSLRVNLRDFEAKKIIGRGHFGEVQVVREKGTGDVYAMKVLRKQETLSHQNIAFYEEERDIMAKSSSPWITKLQYAFQDSQNLYLIMEFHPGGDMLSLLERYDNVLPEQMAQFYLSELVLAIQSVHTMGYVHRDIKPDNILIDRTGHIKLADFGSAAKLNSQKLVTSTMPVGTPDYVAPEVLAAMNNGPALSKSYSMECDWWSLGIVAYEMLFGSTPFSNEKVLMTYNNIMNFKKSLKFPEEASEVSETFIDVIKGLLQDSSNRLGYDQLIFHSLFTNIDWNNLRQTVPPFVPTITSVDDTSNFDDFEPESRPCLGELNRKKEFCGKNLPFVGFTYTSPFETFADRFSSSHNSASSPLLLSAENGDVFSKKNEVVDLQGKIIEMSALEMELKNKIDELKNNLQKKTEELEQSRTDKEALEQILDVQQLEVKELKRLLESERHHRTLAEKKAELIEKKSSQIVSCMKVKHKQDVIKAKCFLSPENRKEEHKQKGLENRLDDALAKIDELIKEKLDLEKQMQDIKTVLQKSQEKIIMAENEHTTLVKLVNKVETQNVQLENEVSSSAEKLENEKQKSSLVQDLEEQLKNEKEIIANLEKQIDVLKQELEHSAAARNSLESSIKSFSEKHSAQIEQNATLRKSCDDLTSELKLVKENISEQVKSKSRMDLSKKCNKCVGSDSPLTERVSENLKDYSKADNSKADYSKTDNSKADYSKTGQYVLSSKNTSQQAFPFKATVHQESDGNKENQSDIRKLLKEKEDLIYDTNLKLRISERKKLQAEDITSALRDSNRTLREKLAAAEKTSADKIKTEKELRESIEHLQQEVSSKKQEMESKENLYKIEKAKLEERVKAVKDTCENTKDICHQFSKSQGQYEEMARQNESLKKELEEKTNIFLQLEAETKVLKQDLLKKQNDCIKYEKIVKILKETSHEMDEQIKELDTLLESRDRTITELKKEKTQLKKEVSRLEEDLKHVDSCLHGEKNARELLEEQISDIESEVENQHSLREAELHSLQEHVEYYKKLTGDLETQIVALEKESSVQDRSMKKHTEKNLFLEVQLTEIKEEAAKHITQISSLKASNLKLTQALDNALEVQLETQRTIEELQYEIESVKINHAHEKVKLQETLSQQSKLIDFLQSKAENMERKKKNNLSRLFGKKDTFPNTFPTQFKDIENILEKEKIRCRRLQDQLSQARAENMSLKRDFNKLSNSPAIKTDVPVSPVSRAMHSVITSSPCPKDDVDSPVSKYIKPPGMKHKIPHRFIEVMCMKSLKCCACLDSIHFGRISAKCQECSVVCHPKCATSLPNTCGLPSGFMQHLKTAIKENSLLASENMDHTISEGWVKLPKSNKQGWERRYLRFFEDMLYVFECPDDISSGKKIECFDFNSPGAKIIITSAVSATELTYAAKSDLPYVLKVEYFPNTTCWPQRCLYIMAPSFTDKQMWVSTLEAAVNRNLSDSDIIQEKQKLFGHPVLTLKGENHIDTHCMFVLNDSITLLGAVEGLFVLLASEEYSCTLKGKIEGISSVYQIKCIKSIGLIVIIEGEKRSLKAVHSDVFRAGVQNFYIQPAHLMPITTISNCHLFSVDEVISKDSPYLCTATSDNVTLYRWDPSTKSFCSQKVIETREPCSCIHFTPNTIIFGAEKFYELDTKTFAVEEFLDRSDASLAGLVFGASQYQSFPVAIFQVSMKNQEEEYLVCFHELGVFVDGFGQRTRSDDLKWSRLPLSFAYRTPLPYLFVTHFNSLEVVEIPPQDSISESTQSILSVLNPQYLGPAQTSGAIYLSSSNNQSIAILLVNGGTEEESQSLQPSLGSSVSISCSSITKSSTGTAESEEELGEELELSFGTSVDQSVSALNESSETLSSKMSMDS